MASEGKITYSEVRTVMHKKPDVISMYKSITTDGNKTISLSENHFIYTRTNHNEEFIAKYVYCSHINAELWYFLYQK